jgi:GDP-L-fucose synthase
VTGGAGFLGSFVVERLAARGCGTIVVPRSASCDLRREDDVDRLYRDARPDILFHLAAVVGGIGANREHPGRFFYDNAAMGLHLIEGARRAGLGKLVCVGTICAYPKHTPVPFREEALWDGYPEETNAPYGIAKKALLTQCRAYREEFGLNAIYLLPVNLYGPRDNFDLETSHVIPALIRKCAAAEARGGTRVTLWGDGTPTREFLYVEDAAEGLLLAAERYDGPEPVNLGTGAEVRIRDLARLIAEATGFSGDFAWDTSRPNGQPRRCLDVSRARDWFGFTARHSLPEGLAKTVAWFRKAGPALREVRFD